MKTFESPSPDRMVGSLLMMGILGGLPQDKIVPLLEKYGLPTELRPDELYPLQPCLDLLREVSEGDMAGMADFVAIGMAIAAHAEFPPEVDDLCTALQALNVPYHMNMPDADESEGWRAEQLDEDYLVAENRSPFPSDLEYGVAYATVRRFCPPGKRFIVEREPLPGDNWAFHIYLEDA